MIIRSTLNVITDSTVCDQLLERSVACLKFGAENIPTIGDSTSGLALVRVQEARGV